MEEEKFFFDHFAEDIQSGSFSQDYVISSSEVPSIENKIDLEITHISVEDDEYFVNYNNGHSVDIDKSFSNELVLKGDNNSNNFVSYEELYDNDGQLNISSYLSSTGNDKYSTNKNIGTIDYNSIEFDTVSGLFISNDPERLPVLSSNDSPIENRNFSDDSLLVHKNLKGDIEIDELSDIDIINFTSKDDYAYLDNYKSEIVIDFGDGVDKLTTHSYGPKPDIESFLNLERLIWHPTNETGETLLNSDNSIKAFEFDVYELTEEKEFTLLIGDYPPKNSEDITWNVSNFIFPKNVQNESKENWLEIANVSPTPELVGKDKVVISHKYTKDIEDDSLTWLEIDVHDFRPKGMGLLGLELDLEWNSNALSIRKSDYELIKRSKCLCK